MPELPLSLDLHLHHRVVGVLDALQSLLDAREQVDDLLLADQDLTVRGRSQDGLALALAWACRSEVGVGGGGGLSPEVRVQIFEDLVLVLHGLDDGLHHLGAVAAHVRFGRWRDTNATLTPTHSTRSCSELINAFLTFAFHLQLLVELNRLFFSATKGLSYI